MRRHATASCPNAVCASAPPCDSVNESLHQSSTDSIRRRANAPTRLWCDSGAPDLHVCTRAQPLTRPRRSWGAWDSSGFHHFTPPRAPTRPRLSRALSHTRLDSRTNMCSHGKLLQKVLKHRRLNQIEYISSEKS